MDSSRKTDEPEVRKRSRGRPSLTQEIIVVSVWHHWREQPLSVENLRTRVLSLWRKKERDSGKTAKTEPKVVDNTINSAIEWARTNLKLVIERTTDNRIHVREIPPDMALTYAGEQLTQDNLQWIDDIFEESDLPYGDRTHAADRAQLLEIIELETAMRSGARSGDRTSPLVDQFRKALRMDGSRPEYCAVMGVHAFAALRSIRRAGDIKLASATVNELKAILDGETQKMSASHKKFFLSQWKLENANLQFAEARRLTDLTACSAALDSAHKLVDAVLKAPLARVHHAEGRLLRGQLIAYGAIRLAKASKEQKAQLPRKQRNKTVESSIEDTLAALTAAYIESLVISNWERAVACMQEIAWVYINAGRAKAQLGRRSIGLVHPWAEALEWAVLAMEAGRRLSVGAYSIRSETAIIVCLRHDTEAWETLGKRAARVGIAGEGAEAVWQWLDSLYTKRIESGVVMAPLSRFDFVRDCAVLALVNRPKDADVWLNRTAQLFAPLLAHPDPHEVKRAERHLRNIVEGDEGIGPILDACKRCRAWFDRRDFSVQTTLDELGQALVGAGVNRGAAQ